MSEQHKLSLPMAILINVNIMLGAGIFINTAILPKYTGALGAFAYGIVGLLLLPLIICIAQLLTMHPSGGFYTYAKEEISSFAGFVSSWSYIIGKLASATIMIHASMTLIQQLIPTLGSVNTLVLDGAIVCAYVGLNLLNMKTGSTIQTMFMVLKAIPIFFAIAVGLFLFDGAHVSAPHLIWAGIPATIPLVFYATMGFEAACSLSSRIKDARKNAPLAIFISYGLVLCIVMLYQTLFYGALGEYLVNAIDYRDAFPGLLQKLLPYNVALGNKMVGILHLALASSALGGAYGIIFSNTWNVFALAENKHLFASDWFATFNKHAIPVGCVILQGAICITYILVTRGNQVPLQTMSSLGVVIAYTLSVASLFAAKVNRPSININHFIPILGLANCALLIFACVRGLIAKGITSLSAFSIFLCLGIVMFMSTKEK